MLQLMPRSQHGCRLRTSVGGAMCTVGGWDSQWMGPCLIQLGRSTNLSVHRQRRCVCVDCCWGGQLGIHSPSVRTDSDGGGGRCSSAAPSSSTSISSASRPSATSSALCSAWKRSRHAVSGQDWL